MRLTLSLPILACTLLAIPAMAEALPKGQKAFSRVETGAERPVKTFEVVPGKESPWSFTIEPYAWLPSLVGDIGVGGLPPVHIDYGSGSMLSAFQWGAFLKGEARYGKWGLLADGMFVDIESQVETPGPLYDNTTVAIQQGLAQFAVAYRVWEDQRGFVDVYAGGRYNYYGIHLSADLNTGTLSDLGLDASGRISTAIARRIQDASIGSNLEALTAEVSQALTSGAIRSAVGTPPTLTPAQKRQLTAALSKVQGEVNGLIRAQAQARVAAASNTLTQGITNAVTRAEQKLAKALSKNYAAALPTDGGGDRWWVDPIIGVRAQVNLTRWLYLATQCDVGGFGAGSQIAWNLNGTIGVNFTRHLFSEVGYRYYYLDYDQCGILYQVAESGIFVGGGVRF